MTVLEVFSVVGAITGLVGAASGLLALFITVQSTRTRLVVNATNVNVVGEDGFYVGITIVLDGPQPKTVKGNVGFLFSRPMHERILHRTWKPESFMATPESTATFDKWPFPCRLSIDGDSVSFIVRPEALDEALLFGWDLVGAFAVTTTEHRYTGPAGKPLKEYMRKRRAELRP